MRTGLGLNWIGPKPGINIHQNRVHTFATFRIRAAQIWCPNTSNVVKKLSIHDVITHQMIVCHLCMHMLYMIQKHQYTQAYLELSRINGFHVKTLWWDLSLPLLLPPLPLIWHDLLPQHINVLLVLAVPAFHSNQLTLFLPEHQHNTPWSLSTHRHGDYTLRMHNFLASDLWTSQSNRAFSTPFSRGTFGSCCSYQTFWTSWTRWTLHE